MFTPIETGIGALLLHQATSVLLFQNGNVLGASGFLRRLMTVPRKETFTFFAGMAMSFPVLKLFVPYLVTSYPPVPSTLPAAIVTIGVGALVGYGTKLSNGCTSGHMLCGLSRLNARSALAVATFFPAAIITHHIVHPTLLTDACNSVLPCYTPTYPTPEQALPLVLLTAITMLAAHVMPQLAFNQVKKEGKGEARIVARQVVQFFAGLQFGLGLHVSQMSSPSKVLAFLSFPRLDTWDPSLGMVMLFGVLPNMIEYQVRGLSSPPLFSDRFDLSAKTFKDVDWRFVLGATLFGIGWGLTGTCPGPAILRAAAQPIWGFLWMSGFWLGSLAP